MKKQADLSKASNLKIEGKKIKEIDVSDMNNMDTAKLLAARQAQIHRERQEKIRHRKLESKRVDHLARALREGEIDLLDQWKDDVEKLDQEYLDREEEAKAVEQKVKHEEALKEREMLLDFQDAKDAWVDSKLEVRREEFEKKFEERKERIFKKIVENKIARARKRKEDWRNEQTAQAREKEDKLVAEKEAKEQEKRDEEKRKEKEEEEERER